MATPPSDLQGPQAAAPAGSATSDEVAGRELTRRAQAIGAVAWASFLSAGVGTMFFFAFIAPDDLMTSVPESDRIDNVGVYTLGFFGLWCLSALASSLALYVHKQLRGDGGNAHRTGHGNTGERP